MYVWRASYLPVMNVDSQFVQDPGQDFDMLRAGLKEWKKLSPFLLKEFYVLTPWHTEEETTGFTAFAFYDPAKGEGALLAFRQEKCAERALSLPLPFLGAADACLLTDADSGETVQGEGAGEITLLFENPRTARLLWISPRSDASGGAV